MTRHPTGSAQRPATRAERRAVERWWVENKDAVREYLAWWYGHSER